MKCSFGYHANGPIDPRDDVIVATDLGFVSAPQRIPGAPVLLRIHEHPARCFFDQHPASVCLGACAKKGGPWAARKDATRCPGDVRPMKPPGGRTRYPSPSAAATRECGAWHSARTRDEPPRYSREGSFFPARCVFLAFTDLRRLNRYVGHQKGGKADCDDRL